MIDIDTENNKPVLVFLVGKCDDRAVSDKEVLRELSSLAETAGLTPAGGTVLRRYEPSPKFGMGAGKARSLSLQLAPSTPSRLFSISRLPPRSSGTGKKNRTLPASTGRRSLYAYLPTGR